MISTLIIILLSVALVYVYTRNHSFHKSNECYYSAANIYKMLYIITAGFYEMPEISDDESEKVSKVLQDIVKILSALDKKNYNQELAAKKVLTPEEAVNIKNCYEKYYKFITLDLPKMEEEKNEADGSEG